MCRKILTVYEDEAQKHKGYNSPPVSILLLEVPELLVGQFKKEIILGFWSCYKNNRNGKGWKKFILTCHEAMFKFLEII